MNKRHEHENVILFIVSNLIYQIKTRQDLYETKFPNVFAVYVANPASDFHFDFYLLQTFAEMVDEIMYRFGCTLDDLKNDIDEYNYVDNVLKIWNNFSFSYKFNITINALVALRGQGYYSEIQNTTIH